VGFNYYISNRDDGNISFYAGTGDVLANRKAICTKLGLLIENLVVMKQSHSSDFYVVGMEDASKGALNGESALNNVDALITSEKDFVLMVQGADCPLIGLYNEESGVLAAIHSGWKGTLGRIIPRVLEHMKAEMGCDHKFTKVIVSPFAKGCCYEVGEEFRETFKDNSSAFNYKDDKLFFDLEIILKEQLLSCGIRQEMIFVEDECTICGKNFYSYRKNKSNAGRFSLLVWMTS